MNQYRQEILIRLQNVISKLDNKEIAEELLNLFVEIKTEFVTK